MFNRSGIGAITLFALGTAAQAIPLDHPLVGPKSLCFKYSTFSLDADERVTDFSGSMEEAIITIESSRGTYEIAESEIFAHPKKRMIFVSSLGEASVYRILGQERTYAIFAPLNWLGDQPLLYISGAALRSTKQDHDIFGRIEARDLKSAKCEQTFTYGG